MNACEEINFSGKTPLVHQIAAGNEQAFKILYECFRRKLVHFSYSIVKVRESSEDIVEDVFVKIWHGKERLTEVDNLKVYLYTSVKNASLNHLSKKAKENITEPFDDLNITLEEYSSPETLLITAEMHKKLQQAVEALPPRCKMIFKLVREDKLRYKEVSRILNISVNTIDVQMAIAVKRIALALQGDLHKSAFLSRSTKAKSI